jgi:sterol desaturase/sphingolipid hydroxylase (fatty acid hydroxylase superfamily)
MEYLVPLMVTYLKRYSLAAGVQLLLGITTAVVLASTVPSRWRIQLKEHSGTTFSEELRFLNKTWKREVPLVLMYVAVLVMFSLWVDHLENAQIIKLRNGWVNNSVEDTAALVFQQWLVHYVLFDVYYYFLHRFAFHGFLWWVHEPHHQTFTPSPLTGFVFHPIESIATGGFVNLCAYLADGQMHKGTIIAVQVFGLVYTLFVHAGVQVLPTWIDRHNVFLTTHFHDLHHSRVACCYGAYTTILDRLFNTVPLEKMNQILDRVDAQCVGKS